MMIDINEIQPAKVNECIESAHGVASLEIKKTTAEHELDTVSNSDTGTALLTLKEELEQWKQRCAGLAAERELAISLSGQSILPGVATQLMRLFRDKVVVQADESQGWAVRSNDGRLLNDAVKEWLQSPEYQHFRVASTKGGTAQRTETNAVNKTVHNNLPVKSLNELVINQWKQRSSASGTGSLWPRT